MMTRAASTLRIDAAIHALALLAQFSLLFMNDFSASGATPAYVYPCFFILASVNVFRINERLESYGSPLVFVPQCAAILVMGFCLINEIGAVHWAFFIPRWHAVWARILWFQCVLLLTHPAVFPLAQKASSGAVNWLRLRGYFRWKIILLLLISGFALWLLRSQNLSPDGYDWLKHSIYPKNWVRYLREPLGTFIFRVWVYWGMDWLHLAPYVSLTLLTIACGWISTALLVPVFRRLFDGRYFGLMLALLLSTFGYTQIFCGNIEIYALLHTGLAAYLFFAMRYWNNQSGVWAPGIVFGILFCAHLSAGWWLPAFLLLPWLKQGEWKPSRAALIDTMRLALAFGGVALGFGLFVLGYGYGFDAAALYDHFWSDQVMLVGTDAAMFRPMADYASMDYYWTMLNEYFYMAPGGCLLLLTLLAGARSLKPVERIEIWFWIMAGFYLIYSITWRPDRHFPADWDLFSGLTIPMAIALGLAAQRIKIKAGAIQYIIYQCAAFSAMYLVLQLIRNHLKATDWPLFI